MSSTPLYFCYANPNVGAGPSDSWASGNLLTTNDSLAGYSAAGATTNDPACLYWSARSGGGFFLNYGDGNGWTWAWDLNGVYVTFNATQKTNIRAKFAAAPKGGYPGTLWNALVSNW
jgi:hypothetical protein